MIIKGSSRGQSQTDTLALAKHLLSRENEDVEVLELSLIGSTSLPDALEEMRLVGLGSRARKLLYHASISLDRTEAPEMSQLRWLEAVDALEGRLGMTGHQRAVVRHIKRGREHVHVVWARVHPDTLKLARDSQNYRKHEECSRALEERWGLRPVVGVHTRTPGTARPVALATHKDWQAQERTGIAVRDVASALSEAWRSTKTGTAFANAIRHQGLYLARGRKSIVVVDVVGTPHAISRRLGLKAHEIQSRLSDLDSMNLPTVEKLQKNIKNIRNIKMNINKKKILITGYNVVNNVISHVNETNIQSYWLSLRYPVEEFGGYFLIRLPNGGTLEDYGDRITLSCSGEPSDEQISAMVEAGKARGWESIRFSGGSPEFQKRARLEALRQGYRLDQISLECEDGTPKALTRSSNSMPDHIKQKLLPVPMPTEMPAPSVALEPGKMRP